MPLLSRIQTCQLLTRAGHQEDDGEGLSEMPSRVDDDIVGVESMSLDSFTTFTFLCERRIHLAD